MGIPPFPRVNPCPNCGGLPRIVVLFENQYRAECRCGVCGPFVKKHNEYPHHDAQAAWGLIFGLRAVPAPPIAGRASP
jgi:hypothetical protein